MSALTGTVHAGGRPAAQATVLAAGASTRTGADGAFTLELPDDVDRTDVLARVGAGDALGLAARTVDLPAREPVALALEDHAPLHPVTVLAEGDVPDELQLQLSPRRIEGIENAAGPMLAVIPFGAERRIERALQAGRWLLFAAHESAPDARGMDTHHLAWEVERATSGGEELARGVVGHEVEIAGPVTVTLHVRVRELP
jgi:hypothetical protein